MRLKQSAEDFRVEEVVDLDLGGSGEYFVHRLEKAKLDTLEALRIVARVAGVDRADIAFAGLKDRQGRTSQWISIRGARVDHRGDGVSVRFVGRSSTPVTSKLSGGNEFAIVVRDLDERDVTRALRNAPLLRASGFANLFDDQRFNCLRHGQGFVMRSVLAGRFDEALRRLIAAPSPVAITGDVKLKRALAEHWGDWERCARIARGPVHQRLFEHLRRAPVDFRGALESLPARLKLIHGFAYQSWIWNRAASAFVSSVLPRRRRVQLRTRAGFGVGWLGPSAAEFETLRAAETPLYGPGGEPGAEAFARETARILREEQLTPESFEAHAVSGMVLRPEPRRLVVVPRDLRVEGPRADDRNRGRKKLRLAFGLPRGAYATMLIKHLFAVAGDLRRAEADGSRATHD
jgi:tRNA pseudouridine13 synthase